MADKRATGVLKKLRSVTASSAGNAAILSSQVRSVFLPALAVPWALRSFPFRGLQEVGRTNRGGDRKLWGFD